MQVSFRLCKPQITIPIKIGQKEKCLEIFDGEEKIFEFMVPAGDETAGQFDCDYIAGIWAQDYEGRLLTVKGDFAPGFMERIAKQEEEYVPQEKRPAVHFTPAYGWINDPNGLIFDGENYHLYFQHNPCNIQWNNMSWGHAISSNLMDWTHCHGVLYPDAEGVMFSGCGLIHEKQYYFPYTVAGTSTPWNSGKPFYQGLAISSDGGMTLVKQKEPFLGIAGKDSRDPKIFWHEETKAYIMVLYLEANDFGIYRSANLKDWEMTQKFTIPKAWECPDLIRVPSQDGLSSRWMFWCADGFYYWGDFDGYRFNSDFEEHHAFAGNHLYATQTYWGLKDRVLSISWIRLEKRNGHCFQGAMAIPKEYEYTIQEGQAILLQKHAREFTDRLTPVDSIPEEGPYLIDLSVENPETLLEMEVNGSQVEIDLKGKKLRVDDESAELPADLPPDFCEIELVVDYNLMEISFSNAIISAYKIAGESNSFKAGRRTDGNIKGCGSQNRADCNYSIKSFK